MRTIHFKTLRDCHLVLRSAEKVRALTRNRAAFIRVMCTGEYKMSRGEACTLHSAIETLVELAQTFGKCPVQVRAEDL